MVIYSGFSTRRQEERYNNLTKELLRLLSQMIITYIESSRLSVFRSTYEKLMYEIGKMDEHKYSDLKISAEVDSLTQHVLNQELMIDSFVGEINKSKGENKVVVRKKRNLVERNV